MKQNSGNVANTLNIIWLAIIMAILILGVIIHVVPLQEDSDIAGESLELALSIAAGFCIITSFALRQLFLNSESISRIRKEAETEQAAIMKLAPFHIVSYALNEGCAILGFVLGFLSGDPSKAYPMLAVGLIVTLFMRPRVES